MAGKKNLCAMFPEELHAKVRQEQEQLGLTLSEYVEQVLNEYYEKGDEPNMENTRTVAFQIPEELFNAGSVQKNDPAGTAHLVPQGLLPQLQAL